MENIKSAKKVQCTIKLVQECFEPALTRSSAQRKMQLLRDALDKQKPKIITMDEFMNYYF